MKKSLLFIIIILLSMYNTAQGFWVWTPQSQKMTNPKYAVKDTPEAQFDWAMSFYNNKDYLRAGEEFVRLVDHYKNSDLAPDAQYYAGLSYQKGEKYYLAYQNFQKVIDNYPFTKRIDEITKAEYDIAMVFYERHKGTLMGVELMTDVEKAIEIFSKIIDNAPYSPMADDAQFMIGMSRKKLQQYNEACDAFQKFIQEYPQSELIEKAKYEQAQCMYLASLKADYDQEATEEAIQEFKVYSSQTRDTILRAEAENATVLLEEKKAHSIFKTAEFYEKQKKYKSATIYYRDIVTNYSKTSYAELAKVKLEYLETILGASK